MAERSYRDAVESLRELASLHGIEAADELELAYELWSRTLIDDRLFKAVDTLSEARSLYLGASAEILDYATRADRLLSFMKLARAVARSAKQVAAAEQREPQTGPG